MGPQTLLDYVLAQLDHSGVTQGVLEEAVDGDGNGVPQVRSPFGDIAQVTPGKAGFPFPFFFSF